MAIRIFLVDSVWSVGCDWVSTLLFSITNEWFHSHLSKLRGYTFIAFPFSSIYTLMGSEEHLLSLWRRYSLLLLSSWSDGCLSSWTRWIFLLLCWHTWSCFFFGCISGSFEWHTGVICPIVQQDQSIMLRCSFPRVLELAVGHPVVGMAAMIATSRVTILWWAAIQCLDSVFRCSERRVLFGSFHPLCDTQGLVIS